MKNFILTLLCLNFTMYALSKNLEPCGTKMDEKTLEWVKKFRQNPINYKSTEAISYVPVQFHIVGTNSGEGYYSISSMFRLLCETNDQYSDVGMQFFLKDVPKYINNSNFYEHNFNNGYIMMAQNNVNNAVNIYMVEDPAGNCGYFSPGVDGVAVSKNCAGSNSSTLAHELGHFFSLPHTFSGWENGEPNNSQQERADGSNCASTGDFFCDTPADYIADRWTCPYTGNLTDPTGAPISPDGSFFMSYANDGCQDKFSLEQIETMHANLQTIRTDLLTNNDVNIQDAGATFILYPATAATNIPADNVVLSWKKTLLAENYYLEIQELGTPNGLVKRVFTTDTFHVTTLPADKNFLWNIKPLTAGNTCAEKVDGSFKTTSENSIYLSNITSKIPTCRGGNDGEVTIEVAGGTAPYTYAWEDGSTANTLENLSADKYEVIVTDAMGNVNTLAVNLPEPTELEVTTIQTDNFKADVTIEGGVAPYQIEWSNGETTAEATNLAIGENTVVITDANGCSTTKSVNVLAIQPTVNQISCEGANDGSIDVLLVGANEPVSYEWNTGATTAAINNLIEGNYELIITDGDENVISLNYDIIEPMALSGNVSVGVGSATANIVGGTAPYTYVWPNSFSTEPSTTGLAIGTYNLLVLDAQNCSFNLSFDILEEESVGINNTVLNKFMVYPTLLTNNQPLTVSFNLLKKETVSIVLYTSTGQQVVAKEALYTTGSQLITIDTNNLSTGLYLVKIQVGESMITKKVMIAQ